MTFVQNVLEKLLNVANGAGSGLYVEALSDKVGERRAKDKPDALAL